MNRSPGSPNQFSGDRELRPAPMSSPIHRGSIAPSTHGGKITRQNGTDRTAEFTEGESKFRMSWAVVRFRLPRGVAGMGLRVQSMGRRIATDRV